MVMILESMLYITGIVCCCFMTFCMYDYIIYCKKIKERDLDV